MDNTTTIKATEEDKIFLKKQKEKEWKREYMRVYQANRRLYDPTYKEKINRRASINNMKSYNKNKEIKTEQRDKIINENKEIYDLIVSYFNKVETKLPQSIANIKGGMITHYNKANKRLNDIVIDYAITA